jgi:hypothetical protein
MLPAHITILLQAYSLPHASQMTLVPRVFSGSDPGNQGIQKLLAAIPNACPDLTCLEVEIAMKSNFNFGIERKPLNLAVIGLIARLPLSVFSIGDFLPLDISQPDMAKIVAALGPTIKELQLNDRPTYRPSTLACQFKA